MSRREESRAVGVESQPTPVSAWRSAWRKLYTIRTVSRSRWQTPLSQGQFVRLACSVHSAAVASGDVGIQTAAFWRMENLASTYIKASPAQASLRDGAIPAEILPILHCGMGIGAVEVARFRASEFDRLLDSFAHPDYRLFACESIGAMLAVYEPDVVGLLTQALGTLGMIPLTSQRRPDPSELIRFYPEDVRRLISHGYGRLLYFKQPSFGAALRGISQRSFLQRIPALQGIAFAYAMVNHFDLESVLNTRHVLTDAQDRVGFEAGLTYALIFWEWMIPGFLSRLPSRFPSHRDLILKAALQVERERRQGGLSAFLVQTEA